VARGPYLNFRAMVPVLLAVFFMGCGVKVEQLPLLSSPYVSEVEFLKEVSNDNGKARKKHFDDDLISSPFYFFLKVKEIENNGTLQVVFFESPGTREKENGKKVAAREFSYGQPGKYYEYIIFFDRVDGLTPGNYHYGVFLNQHLIYEGLLKIAGTNRKNGEDSSPPKSTASISIIGRDGILWSALRTDFLRIKKR
jgi:hypothetical protein